MDDRNRSSQDNRDTEKGTVGGRLVGEGVGGVGGIAAGAAIGSLAGPVGTFIGALAGAVGGWWAGKEVVEAASSSTDDDPYYREHYESSTTRLADRTYDDVRPAYQLGHLAARNPDYQGRRFEEIEPELRQGWSNDLRAKHGDWSEVRSYASDAYTRGRTGSAGAADRTGDAMRRGANRVIDAVDNVKDRIDGNPASRPGPDPTDTRL